MKDFIHRIAIRFFATPQKPRVETLRDLAAFLLSVAIFSLAYAVPLALALTLGHPGDAASNLQMSLNAIGLFTFVATAVCYSTFRQFFLNLLALVFLKTLGHFAADLVALQPQIASSIDVAVQWMQGARGSIGLVASCAGALCFLLLVATPLADMLARYLFSGFDSCRNLRRPWQHVIPFSKLDHRSIAIHEAGHAVIMAFDPLIDDTCRVVLSKDPSKGSFGYCRHANWPHNVHTYNYHVMRMIGLLAGVEAERVVLGAPGMGGRSDYREWLEAAQLLLLADPDNVYFAKPKTAPEIEHNRLTLNDLRKQHQAMARRILEVNQEVLERMAARLTESLLLKGEGLKEFLDEVKPVEGMPDLSVYHKAQAETVGIRP